jgi:protein-S-isoprenylcysteine O-methyltransferase Ste14
MAQNTNPIRPAVAGRPGSARMPALIIVIYAAVAYLLFLAVSGYAAGFFADFGVPRAVDRGPHAGVLAAVGTDLALLTLFAVQHTVMARPWFKRRWTRIVPEPAERATFVLAANLVLVLLFWLWRPVAGTVWSVPGPGAGVLWAGYAAGWALVLSATFGVSHFDLFGLRQAWLYVRRVRYSPPAFTERGLYRRIRHPLMAGFVVVFWSVPVMTAGHVLFAAAATGYIAVGIAFEEHDLTQSLGKTYTAYRARVPALIPVRWLRRVSGELDRQAEALGQQPGPLPVLSAERAIGPGEADVVQ